ncbi:MAG: hypothetical protein J7463_14350 [Roseiflexus sp.]|jgi:non-ribosomal peptide synthetase component E (peptide arylation enzyme)|nr:hypothetical protein [Roseiflexus sp.]MBO9335696.1 hypothetical protein [Roseiflexus sp.]MBO9342053.1 hypothetical protein [Roseiflexus sp.]MBO9365035.1 hypothetical protein [Roseiflexus sp.]MBO9383714.1 hypothetical protein [Roseiflexus sp.]
MILAFLPGSLCWIVRCPICLVTAACEYPAALEILFYSRVIDYATFDRLALRFAIPLRNAGVAPGEGTALVLPNQDYQVY